MARGFKTGGRKRGTPNKRTQAVVETLESMGVDPVRGLATIASDENNPVELRARCFADLMPYVYPKRKAVELSGPDEGCIPLSLIDELTAAVDQAEKDGYTVE